MFNKNAKILSRLMILLVIIGGANVYAAKADDSPGLLLIAHGAPMPAWNKPVLELEKPIVQALGKDNPFKKVKVCFMEFVSPRVSEGVADLEKAGCNRIVAVPLLIAPSSHSKWDIPTLLGLYTDKETAKDLKEEGSFIVHTKTPIILTASLYKSKIIVDSMVDRVKELSKNPKDEAVIILSHGDAKMKGYWDSLMKRISSNVCGRTGITYSDWAYVHVGQTYGEAKPVITEASTYRKRIILVGCYISMGVEKMHRRYTMSNIMFGNPFKGTDIVTSKRGLLPDPRVVKWVAETAKNALCN